MDEKDKSTLHHSFHVKAITFLVIVIIVTGIFVLSLMLNQNQIAIAQEQQKEQALASKDISFDINNVTFSDHMASVNGIQLRAYAKSPLLL